MAKGRGSDDEDGDFEEELLQLTEKKSNKRNKSIESSDEDYEETKSNKKKKTTTGSGPGRKKGSSTLTSLQSSSTTNYGGRRNRGAPVENDDDFYDGYDQELYKDDDDRYELSQLPEIEREDILASRYDQRKDARELWKQQKEREKKTGTTSTTTTSSTTSTSSSSSTKQLSSSTRGRSEKEDKQKEALKDIQRKREKSKKDKDQDEDSSSNNTTPASTSTTSTPKTTSSKIEQDHRDKEKEKDKERERERTIEKDIQSFAEKVNVTLLNQCRLSRNMLVKWVDQPYFEHLAPNFFVRVVIGSHLNNPIYRIAEIIEVRTGHKLYKVENKETDKLLLLSYAGSRKEFGIENVSNNVITPSEHEKWISDMVRAKQKLPEVVDIEKKIADIKVAQDYIYTNEDIEKRALEKQKHLKTPVNIAIEKAKFIALRETLDPASTDYQKVVEKIEELNKMTNDLKEENMTSVEKLVANINKKNKSLNFKFQATTTQATEVVSNDSDPFARRKTRNCAVVAVDSESIIAGANLVHSPLSPTKLIRSQVPQTFKSRQSGESDTRSLSDIHRSIDLNISIPNTCPKILKVLPKRKRQPISTNLIKDDHSMYKQILSLEEYESKRQQ